MNINYPVKDQCISDRADKEKNPAKSFISSWGGKFKIVTMGEKLENIKTSN